MNPKYSRTTRVSVKKAAESAPTLSRAVLRRNMLEHESQSKTISPSLKRSVEHIVSKVRKELTAKHLGSEMDDTFGNLVQFAEVNEFSALMRKHNDPEDPYHFKLYEFVLLGSEFLAQRDIVRMTVSSLWILANVLRTIIAGKGFQLNGNVTGRVRRLSIDLLEFGVNSIPKRNNVLCLAIIPKATESEKLYQLTWDDLRAAVLLL